jgi:DNA-binding LacI/PurR family transcriptional regulator
VLGARPDRARPAFAELLGRDRPPTAVLVMSDMLAAGVLRWAAERGLDVPGQLSVIGFDDVPFARTTDPPLTTVSQPTEEKGRLAARTLLDALESGRTLEPTRRVLPAELVVRGSTGPPPA